MYKIIKVFHGPIQWKTKANKDSFIPVPIPEANCNPINSFVAPSIKRLIPNAVMKNAME